MPGETPDLLDGVDELTRARMDIAGLKLTTQVLLIYLAHTRGKEDMGRELEEIHGAVVKSIDRIEFVDADTAPVWREGVKECINNIFGSLMRVKRG